MKSAREGYKMTEFGEIPSDWDFKSLKDICYIKGRIGWQGLRKDEFISEGPYLITGINFDRGRIIWNECYHITNERYEQAPEIQLKVGDVLMTKDGTIGKLLYVDNLPDKASLNSHLFVMRPINDSFISKYFYYHLQSEKFKKYIDNNKTGSTMPAITQAAMEKYKLILPTLEEQEKIASILSTVDEQIDNVDVLIKKNKDLKKGLMQTLLTKGIGHTKFKKTEIGEIPEEWEVRRLEDICDDITIGMVKTMTKFYVDNGVPLIRNSDIKENTIKTDSMVYLDKEFSRANQSKCLNIGQIVTVHTGDIGTSAVIEENMQGAQGFATLNTTVNKSIINEYYLCWYLNSDICKNQAYSFSTGDGRNNLNLKDFVNILAIVPSSIEEQKKIVFILNSISRKIQEYENKKQKLEELKKGLMQQLLSGKIRVK